MTEKTLTFINRANIVHNNKYDYSKVEYLSAKQKVCIICPIHGEFFQSPSKHLSKQGCPKCGSLSKNNTRKTTTEEFIRRSKEKYGNKFLYDKCNVKKMQDKVTITCKKHGDFQITPSSHLRNDGGCPKCLQEKKHTKYASTTNTFIERAKEVHGDKYDYSKVNYINNRTKVCIICPNHGEFWQMPYKHINRKDGCHKCGYEQMAQNSKFTTDSFIKRAKEVHGDKYDYSKTEYKSYGEDVVIICKQHGEFLQTPDSHLQGSGCQKCSFKISKYESEIFTYINHHEDAETRNRTILNGKELDIYVPSKHIAIEYNGLRWHSEEFGKDKWYHLNKTLECNKKGIKLLQIFEDEYVNHKDIVLNKIQHILHNNNLPKIMGRKCQIESISKTVAEEFLNKFHIQGYARSTVYLGAYYENNLIAVMTFKREIKNSTKWELTRFASDYNYICQGVGGKLFKWFLKQYEPTEVKSFADRRWTVALDNNIYTKLGFKLEKILNPDYRYYNDRICKYGRIHKFNCRKQILHKKYGFPLTMTETEMAKKLGLHKIWDCGLFKFVWKKEKD